MPDYQCLPDVMRPLADKFYRSQRSAMRTRSDHRVWVARDGEIVAALCLQTVAHGQWLTSLLVAPQQRGQGLASALIDKALQHAHGPTWLFCHPDLLGFYGRLGFTRCTDLPDTLAERLQRYRRKKPLDALSR